MFDRIASSLFSESRSQTKANQRLYLYCDDHHVELDSTTGRLADTQNDVLGPLGSNSILSVDVEGNYDPNDHATTYSNTVVGIVRWSAMIFNPLNIKVWATKSDLSITSFITQLLSGTVTHGGTDHADNICASFDILVAHEVCALLTDM
jgi:hypothetical protein